MSGPHHAPTNGNSAKVAVLIFVWLGLLTAAALYVLLSLHDLKSGATTPMSAEARARFEAMDERVRKLESDKPPAWLQPNQFQRGFRRELEPEGNPVRQY